MLLIHTEVCASGRALAPSWTRVGSCVRSALRKCFWSKGKRSHPDWDFKVNAVANSSLAALCNAWLRRCSSGASERSLHFEVMQSSTFFCSDAFRVRNQLANLSCPLLDTAAVGRQLWTCISKYIYGTSIYDFVLSELSLGKSLFMTIHSGRLYCQSVSVVKVEIMDQLWFQPSFISCLCTSTHFILIDSHCCPVRLFLFFQKV